MAQKLNTENFIRKAREVHGDRYDYSKTNYINSKTKVTIICPEHGEFEQNPNSHLQGCRCIKCSNSDKQYNTEDFIKKAREVHGARYDYSKVNYVNSRTKVTIICPEHGEFEQNPSNHLLGQGCNKCLNWISRTEDFIKKAREIHGDRYDYSKTNYINSKTKVTIICPEHGEFEQLPGNHYSRGRGCPLCNGGVKYNLEDFIKKARNVHGDKYDYSKVNYINCFTKVTIICPEHGEFNQQPSHHTNGCGCPKCLKLKLNTEDFIKKAREVHGDKYDYSKTVYIGTAKKIKITCPIHGDFEQGARCHLIGQGCPQCNCRKSNTEDFIKKARNVHGDRYDYSKTNYINSKTKVTIICPEHGEFDQQPNNHLQGKGCSICNCSHLERDVELLLISIGLIENNSDTDNRTNIFKTQHRFLWLKYYKKMSLDFYIPILNLAIECQGNGHFEPIKHSRKQSDDTALKIYKGIQKRDKIKKELCEKNGIEIIYYLDEKYTHHLKNGEKYFTSIKELKKYLIDKMSSVGINVIKNRHYLTNRFYMESLF